MNNLPPLPRDEPHQLHPPADQDGIEPRANLDATATTVSPSPAVEVLAMAGRSLTEEGGADRRFDEFDSVAMPDALRAKLAPHHYRMLAHDSRIADDVIEARGYRTVNDRKELKALGFTGAQLTLSGLVIPLHDVNGEVFAHQLRPDVPREEKGKPGKVRKYEYASGYKPQVDVPPSVRGVLPDPRFPLWICEGVRKVDALVTAGVHAIALGSVTLWRGTGPEGGVTALPCWERIAFKGQEAREFVIAFDSDTTANVIVWKQAERLGRWIASRGALVRYLHLPDAADGSKQGVDDFLAAGGTVEGLRALVSDELPAKPNPPDTLAECDPYRVRRGAVEMLVPDPRTGEERTVTLANFGALITEEIELRDGETVLGRTYRIDVENIGSDECARTVEVGAELFDKDPLGWVARELGARAALDPSQTMRSHFTHALKLCSRPTRRVVFNCTGWEKIDGVPRYLHAAGALGADGNDSTVEVRLGGKARHYSLPDPAGDVDELRGYWRAVRDDVLKIVPSDPAVGLAFLSVAIRSLFGPCPDTVWLFGPTGSMKSSAAAAGCLSFFGAGFHDANELPENWNSTANHIEATLHAVRDAVTCIDDMVQSDSGHEQDAKMRRILRQVGNGQNRGRMKSGGGAQSDVPPRGTVLSTSEHAPPPDEGLTGRTLALGIEAGAVCTDTLTRCQEHARAGKLAKFMASFIAWFARDLDHNRAEFAKDFEKARTEVCKDLTGTHSRTAGAVASLLAAVRHLAAWLHGEGVIDRTEFEKLRSDSKRTLVDLGQRQAALRRAADPAQISVATWRSMLAAGLVHLRPVNGYSASDADLASVGWRERTFERMGVLSHTMDPQGECIGWIKSDEALLDPVAALAALKREVRRQGGAFNIAINALADRLLAAGLTIGEERRGKESGKARAFVPRQIDKRALRVLAFERDVLLGEGEGEIEVEVESNAAGATASAK